LFELLDPCSSALWFDGWAPEAEPALAALAAHVRWGPPVVSARGWLLSRGWRALSRGGGTR